MPTENNNNQDYLPDAKFSKKPGWLLIFIIFSFIILIIFLLLIWKKTPEISKQTNGGEDPRALVAILPKEAPVVYVRGGIITQKKDNYFVITSQVRSDEDDPALAFTEKTFTIYFNNETRFIKSNYQNFNQTQIVPIPEPAQKSEFKTGQSINARSTTNIKNLDSFTASEIELIY